MLAASARDLPPATIMFVLLTVLSLLLGVGIWLTPVKATQIRSVRPAPVQLGEEPEIRVRVLRRTSETSVSSGSSLIVEDHLGQTTQLSSPVTLSINNGVFSLTLSDGGGVADYTDQPFTIRAPLIEVGSLKIEGELRVHPAIGAPDRFDVVAHLPIERYLPGVLAGELLSGWPAGVFEAQAVAARSYALHERELAMKRGRAWDVERTTRSQSYVGQTSLPVAVNAVSTTRGQVLQHDGQLLRAYYCSSVGGRAASAADVYRTDEGFEFNLADPLQASDREYFDQDSPTHRWERTRDIDNLSGRIRDWASGRRHPAQQLGRLTQITPSAHNAVGRPSTYTLQDDRGRTASLTAEQLRVACNFSNERYSSVEFARRVLSSDIEFQIKGAAVTVTGRGFGHGVGMCQYSAAELAQRGEHYTQILARYYPGAAVVRWYD